MEELPPARLDGICCDCLKECVVTNDRRFCRRCLRRRIAGLTPMIGCYPRARSGDQRENIYETKNGRDG